MIKIKVVFGQAIIILNSFLTREEKVDDINFKKNRELIKKYPWMWAIIHDGLRSVKIYDTAVNESSLESLLAANISTYNDVYVKYSSVADELEEGVKLVRRNVIEYNPLSSVKKLLDFKGLGHKINYIIVRVFQRGGATEYFCEDILSEVYICRPQTSFDQIIANILANKQ